MCAGLLRRPVRVVEKESKRSEENVVNLRPVCSYEYVVCATGDDYAPDEQVV